MVETFAELRRKPSFWWMAIAASLVAFVGYGLISFQALFLTRVWLTVRDAALNLARRYRYWQPSGLSSAAISPSD